MSRSSILFSEAQQYIPGGVNSPVRAFKGVGGDPLFIKRGEGAYLMDEDDHRYIDYVGSWGPMILGHSHPAVIKAVQQTITLGLGFGAPMAVEIAMAKTICQRMPAIESVRLVSSGTEATMSAIRLARAATGRDKILKFDGCYHGHADSLLVNAGSGGLTFGVPSSPGVPADFAKHTLTANYNDLDSVTALFEHHGKDIAAIIVEPVAGNMNCVLPHANFLSGLREICDHYQSLLIFDEVITGFRVAAGGAQQYFNVTPDLTTLGKIIGGGLAVGAFGGRKAIMELMAPVGPVYQAGTLSGNPVAISAGLATLNETSRTDFYELLSAQTLRLVDGIKERARAAKIPLHINAICGIFGLFFTEQTAINDLSAVMRCDKQRFQRFFHAMLAQGIYLAPSAYESGFISSAHGDKEITATLDAIEKVFATL